MPDPDELEEEARWPSLDDTLPGERREDEPAPLATPEERAALHAAQPAPATELADARSVSLLTPEERAALHAGDVRPEPPPATPSLTPDERAALHAAQPPPATELLEASAPRLTPEERAALHAAQPTGARVLTVDRFTREPRELEA